jgi:exopolysaccharide biosynthesis polyprenyl glycosylphosphotransferase
MTMKPALAATGIALIALVTLTMLAQPAQALAQALALALTGAVILLGTRSMPGTAGAGMPVAAAPADQLPGPAVMLDPAGRLAFDEFVAGTGSTTSFSPAYAPVKRAIDLVAALLVALAVLPLFPLVAFAIRIDSPGSVFYRQDRVGLDGRTFRIYKFRTMRSDAERHGAVWASEGDPRVTRVGGFMRRSRIDELPQLLNVVRGEMTFVGPRPERPEFTSLLEQELPGYGQRQRVKPGLTGWAQIRYQYASSIQDTETKLEYDLYYVRHRSLLFDLRILFQTIPVVLHLQGR